MQGTVVRRAALSCGVDNDENDDCISGHYGQHSAPRELGPRRAISTNLIVVDLLEVPERGSAACAG